ncbi:hypothetical protein [Modestobacter roseus]|nr:hypothetical protein [Modestobacter roseus]
MTQTTTRAHETVDPAIVLADALQSGFAEQRASDQRRTGRQAEQLLARTR